MHYKLCYSARPVWEEASGFGSCGWNSREKDGIALLVADQAGRGGGGDCELACSLEGGGRSEEELGALHLKEKLLLLLLWLLLLLLLLAKACC